MGAVPGAAVTIGDVSFDWKPTMDMADDEFTSTRRGEDNRLIEDTRPAASDRLAAKKSRRVSEDSLDADMADFLNGGDQQAATQ